MVMVLISAVFGSAATAYAIGYRIVAPKNSFLRTRIGAWLLLAFGLTFVILPPQLISFGHATGSLVGTLPASVVEAFSLPQGFNMNLYLTAWIVLTLIALLVGMRIWRVREPDWRPGASRAVETAVVRAQGLLPLANSLDDVLATLAKAPLSARDIEFLGPQIVLAGARFSAKLPEKRSEAFNLVARTVPPAIATRVTELLQQGAAEKAAATN